MARSIIGSWSGSSAGGSALLGATLTSFPSGARRLLIVSLNRGYDNDNTDTFSNDLGAEGQTASPTDTAFAGSASNGEQSVFVFTETQIAAALVTNGGGEIDLSYTYATALSGGAVTVRWNAVCYQDANQTVAGAAKVSGYTGSSPLAVSVTGISSGDEVVVFGGVRMTGTLSSDSGFTNVAGATATGSGGPEDCSVRVDTITSSGTSQNAGMVFTGDELAFLNALAVAEDTGGVGGISVPVAMHHRRTMGLS